MDEPATRSESELAALARRIIDENRFMTIATADGGGRPWASPVWYAHFEYREFFWVSRPDARHSVNIAARREVGVVIFDSTVIPGEGEAVYLSAVAGEVPEARLEQALEVYSARSEASGLPRWPIADVTSSARHRLFVATASEQFVLDEHDRRLPVVAWTDRG
jgi:pyridoxine/pyridoxamine 5'-phosphate oxidase